MRTSEVSEYKATYILRILRFLFQDVYKVSQHSFTPPFYRSTITMYVKEEYWEVGGYIRQWNPA